MQTNTAGPFQTSIQTEITTSTCLPIAPCVKDVSRQFLHKMCCFFFNKPFLNTDILPSSTHTVLHQGWKILKICTRPSYRKDGKYQKNTFKNSTCPPKRFTCHDKWTSRFFQPFFTGWECVFSCVSEMNTFCKTLISTTI